MNSLPSSLINRLPPLSSARTVNATSWPLMALMRSSPMAEQKTAGAGELIEGAVRQASIFDQVQHVGFNLRWR